MTREEFAPIAINLTKAYKRDNFLADKETVDFWYEMLSDIDGDLVKCAAYNYVKTNTFQPTIADIRRGCAEIQGREDRYRGDMRDIFDVTKGMYPGVGNKMEQDTMKYWNMLTSGIDWQARITRARALSNEIARYISDAERNGDINNIPTFTGYLKYLARDRT